MVPLTLAGSAEEAVAVYLNRLSDYLFTAARLAVRAPGYASVSMHVLLVIDDTVLRQPWLLSRRRSQELMRWCTRRHDTVYSESSVGSIRSDREYQQCHWIASAVPSGSSELQGGQTIRHIEREFAKGLHRT